MELINKSIHFVGIGGIGMQGLAELLHNLGSKVSGSDVKDGIHLGRLRKLGLNIFIGHESNHISPEVEIVVYSSAIAADNIELLEAKERGLIVIRRAEALANLMRLKKGLVVAGTHGKTTTTALLASIFVHAKRDPTVVAGGRLDLFKSTAYLGNGKWFIAESDESDASFLHLFPELVVLTNIDEDHIDFYGSFFELKKTFSQFLKKVPFYGSIIACGDCPNVREIVETQSLQKVLFYGLKPSNDFVLKREEADTYSVYFNNKPWVKFKSSLIGEYNALNSLAAIVCATHAGISKKLAVEGIEQFQGVERRMEFKGECKDILFYDDYAHHPTEVQACLKGLKDKFPKRRRVVLFQPHRFTRFKHCWKKFLKSFDSADVLYITPVYSSSESSLKNVTSEKFVKQITHPACYFLKEDQIDQLKNYLKPNDVFITLGAGSSHTFSSQVLESLGKESTQTGSNSAN